ncbi:MAG: DUF4956 domain-containing protein [Verrucomicrobiales bacterium]|nr:DUF4956 domain-containing protein [Verrucomicrobiales bacterium]MBV63973.1 DUF4956 domain-containing protein [Rickettsiales bacterium]|tara:strand:+ start:720 stop:1403 length:684 start_codon:yes stop_codon:yes gene_type:complete
MESFLTALGPTKSLESMEVLFSLSVSFVLGLILATVYRWTHQSFSYARSFLHTMVLATIVITIMIMAIGNNMARGLGIMGAMAFVRFRTPIRDPRDIIFLFASLSIGIASGAQVFGVAIIGTLYFCFTALFLSWSPFASRREFEGLLRFMMPPDSPSLENLQAIFTRYTSSTEMVAMREAIQGEVQEYSYQIRLIDPSYKTDLVDSLSKLDDISEVSLVMQRTTVEI